MSNNKLKTVVEKVLNAGYQLESEAYKLLASINEDKIYQLVDGVLDKVKKMDPRPIFITKDMINLHKVEEPRLHLPQKPTPTKRALAVEYDEKLDILLDPTNLFGSVGTLDDFHKYFKNRVEKLSKILKERMDVKNARPLSESFKALKDRPVKSIVIISDKREKAGRILLRIEDFESEASVLVPSSDRILYRKAQMLSLDQVVCLELVSGGGDLLIARDIIFPGIPERKIVKNDNPLSALLISDLHFGSKTFLYKEFEKLIGWIKGDIGNSKQKAKAGKIKYIIITGDLVDGVGVYPEQEKELAISNIYEQYLEMSKYFQEIPDYIDIIVIPGNHDAVRQALPQPAIPKEFAEPIYELENVTSLGNPSLIRVGGRKFLLYHGTSLNDITSSVPSLSLEKPEKILKYIMDVRHMAPSFGSSTPIAPEPDDILVIDDVPDVVQSGHIHVAGYEIYRGTLLVSCASWQDQTDYQKKMGLTPTVGKAVTLNLGSFDIGIIDFTMA